MNSRLIKYGVFFFDHMNVFTKKVQAQADTQRYCFCSLEGAACVQSFNVKIPSSRSRFCSKVSPKATLFKFSPKFRYRNPEMSNFTDALVVACHAEHTRFDGGKLEEGDAKVFRRVGEYWKAIPIQGIDGRTKVKDKKGDLFNPAWSSAFISFIARTSGAGSAFHYSEAHCHYVERARQAALSASPLAAYYAVDPYSAVPGIGDIICAGRDYAKGLSFKQAALAYKADSFYPSHSDFVIEVNRDQRYVLTMGGNVGNSVQTKRLTIAPNGRLLDVTVGPTVLPWLALLRCRI